MMSSPYSWIQPDSQQVFFESLFLCSAVGKVRSWRICRNKSGEGMEITGRVLHMSETTWTIAQMQEKSYIYEDLKEVHGADSVVCLLRKPAR